MGRKGGGNPARLTLEELEELARLETRCRELEAHKGVTDTVHHDRLRELKQKAAGAGHIETLKEETHNDPGA